MKEVGLLTERIFLTTSHITSADGLTIRGDLLQIVNNNFTSSGEKFTTICTNPTDMDDNAPQHAANEALEFFNENHRSGFDYDSFIKVPKEIFEKLDEIINPKPIELDLFADYNFNE